MPPQDWAQAAHSSNCLDNTPFISSSPSLPSLPTPLIAFSGIISQINNLQWNPCVKNCFWGIQTKAQGCQLIKNRAFKRSFKFFLTWQLNFYLTLLLVWVSPKAGPEKRIWVQVIYLRKVPGSKRERMEQGDKERKENQYKVHPWVSCGRRLWAQSHWEPPERLYETHLRIVHSEASSGVLIH